MKISRERIEIGYKARDQFVSFHMRKQRWAVIVSHRRAGKTVATIMDLVDHALRCEKKNGRFAYIAPQYVQAEDAAWSYLKEYGLAVPGATSNEGKLRVDFPNGSRVRLYGSDNYNRMRGIYLDGAALDEVARFDPRAYPEVIRPALADRKGFAVFIGTPNGRKNYFYKLREKALLRPDWFYLELKASNTKLLDDEELADAKDTMSADQYLQEFECDFAAAVPGSYYGDFLVDLENEGRICDISPVVGVPIETIFNIGIGDKIGVLVFQVLPDAIHLLDYVEGHGKSLAWYSAELDKRGWRVTTDWVPQEAKIKGEGPPGRTRVETLAHLGRAPKLVPDHKFEDGINALRLALPKMWVDGARCERVLDSLREYQAEYDDRAASFLDTPRNDWTVTAADAARYLAVAYRERTPRVRRPKFAGIKPEKLTVNDLLRQARLTTRNRWV